MALIRLSGPASPAVAAAIFRPASPRFGPADQMAGYTCAPGVIVDPTADPEIAIDQVVLTRFAAPHSFTGEEVYEITCHGGQAVRQAILDLLLHLGVQPAGPGEFTRRAFLNGKLDLAQAEAVMDLISASAEKLARTAMRQLQGQLSTRIRSIRQQLYDVLAQLELVLEYPEHEESEAARTSLSEHLRPALEQVAALAESFRQGRILSEGFNVVIVGRPNAGKSSLLNALAGYDRAIVTPIAGTTRDTVEETINIGGIPVRLVDTAGLRETADLIERIGVDRARTAILDADLVLWLIAPEGRPARYTEGETVMTADEPASDLAAWPDLADELDELRDLSEQTDALLVIAGKEDLEDRMALREILDNEIPDLPRVSFSAVTLEGLEAVRQSIMARYEQIGSGEAQDVLITSGRHKACLDRCLSSLELAANGLKREEMLDLTASMLRDAMESLAEITGDLVSDTIIETIFSRFCVGK